MTARSETAYLRCRFGAVGAEIIVAMRASASILAVVAMAGTGERRPHADRYTDKVRWLRSSVRSLRILLHREQHPFSTIDESVLPSVHMTEPSK